MKTVKWVAGLGAALILSMILGGYLYLRSTLPEYDGKITIDGIENEVEILRDSYGMAHIYATSDNDAFFALGYCTAQDRMLQMDLIRRSVRGELSEIIGPELVRVDRLFRTITSPLTVDSMIRLLSPEVVSALEAYSAGVNRYLSQEKLHLPFEFALLGYEPKPWRPSDCLTVLYYMAWALNFSFDSELINAMMTEKVGPDMAAEIFIDYPQGAPTIVGESESYGRFGALLETISLARRMTNAPFRGASNNWVIDGKKSASGMPLVANDMHLGLAIPSIWYEAHISSENLNVSGVIIPGAPLIIAGANEHIAWGFTNIMADDADYYLEKIDPEDSNRYLYKGNWQDMTIIHDTIKVKNGNDVDLKIRITNHGPIIDDIIELERKNQESLAMRWTIYDFGREGEAIFLLNRASNIDEIEEAAKLFKCPGQNWVFADDAGNIGYRAAVAIPIREGFSGQPFLPGWEGEFEWSGYLPFEQQPHLRNPEKGWIATANNKITGDDYPWYISHYYAPPDRIRRITEMIEAKNKLSMDDIKNMQADDLMLMAQEWMPIIIQSLENMSLSEREQEARDVLSGWDFYASSEKSAPTIFHVFFQYLLEYIFKERLGEELYFYFLNENTFTVHKAVENLVTNNNSQWFDDPTTDKIEMRSDAFGKSFRDAIVFLETELGDDIKDWKWGKQHTITFYNLIGKNIPFLGRFMNAGPYEMGSGTNCVNATLYRLTNPWAVIAGASQRHIFDLGNIENSLRSIPTGISENFMSPHYKDQLDNWLKVEHRPFSISRANIEKDVSYKLQMLPTTKTAVSELK